jgi:DAK2 domain fusion protein YloV
MDLERARELSRGALQALEASKQRINDLNVYPVPDGDTGTNLVATVRGVVEQLETSTAQGPREVAEELKRAALFEAKGNSGVIFSQIVRGFADVLGEREPIDSDMVVRSFRSASDAAYRAVQRPVEGTMLTVIREMAEELEQPGAAAMSRNELLVRAVLRGEDALARTPEMLAVLKEAGVVDAGGAGLVEIVRGLAATVAGEVLPEIETAPSGIAVDAIHQELSEFRYCTVYVVEGTALDRDALERELDPLGDSLLVVGDEVALKVHVHTDEPGAALSAAIALGGTLGGVEIANMHEQTVARTERLEARLDAVPTLHTGVVAVAAGAGNRQLFAAAGVAKVIEGGQTMNPSIGDIVAAVDAVPADEVIVLPNNGNVLLAAKQAVGLAVKPARVIETRTLQAGLEAINVYEPGASAAENEAAMLEAIDGLATGEVTRASRDTTIDGVDVRKDAWIGLVGERVLVCDDVLDAVADRVVDELLAGGKDVLTILLGDGAPDRDALLARISERHPEVEAEAKPGGQPHYALLLAAP